jgi:hypothetical protein
MKHNNSNDYTLLDTLRYNSLFSSQEFKVDTNNNLQIVENSPLSDRNETIPLDFISPQPIVKRKLDSHLVLLAVISSIVSALFFSAAIFASQLWAVSFAIVFYVISISSIVTSFNKSTTTYKYNFANTNTHLFTLYEPFTANKQAEKFVNALEKRITDLNIKTEELPEIIQETRESNESVYGSDKRSQYIKPLDFLYNHGIVDDVLYEELTTQIDIKTNDSQDVIQLIKADDSNAPTPVDNIIYFPVNA